MKTLQKKTKVCSEWEQSIVMMFKQFAKKKISKNTQLGEYILLSQHHHKTLKKINSTLTKLKS
jgi:hypothetical protein